MGHLDIKYQIFVSSTWKDLEVERNNVIETVLKHYHFPIGMEMFNADNETQWKVISKTIDSSDLYVIVVGHRYGSLTKGKNGISYTEKEFNYALKKKIPILAFIRDRHQSIDPAKIDKENETLLEKFIARINESGITTTTWTTSDDLGKKVSVALSKMVNKLKEDEENDATKVKPGWIKRSALENSTLTSDQKSILKNSSVINTFLEESADNFEVVNEDIDIHIFDDKCNCIIERTRIQECMSDVTHTFTSYKCDKKGDTEVLETTDVSSRRIGKKLTHIVCEQTDTTLKFCVFLNRIYKKGDIIKTFTKVSLKNYLSDLIDKGKGQIRYNCQKNTSFKNRKDVFIFPNKPKFQNITVKLISIYSGKSINKKIPSTIEGNKKTFTIEYGTIIDNFDIVVEFKLN